MCSWHEPELRKQQDIIYLPCVALQVTASTSYANYLADDDDADAAMLRCPAAAFTPSMYETKDLVFARQVAIQGTNNTLDRLAALNDARVFEGGKPNKAFEAAFAPINSSWYDQNLSGKKWTSSSAIFSGLNNTMALANNFTTLAA
jgi:hypothetical protein